MEIEEEPYLQVLWTRDALLKHKEFPLEKKEQAFNWYWRINGDQIVLRLPDQYPTSFSESLVPEHIRWHPTKEGYRGVFEEWLKEKLPSQGMGIEGENPVHVCKYLGKKVIDGKEFYLVELAYGDRYSFTERELIDAHNRFLKQRREQGW